MSKQNHPFFNLQAKQIAKQLRRITGQVRNRSLTKQQATVQVERLLEKSLERINKYALRVNTQTDLGLKLKPLSPEDLQRLRQNVTTTLAKYKEILADVK